MHIRFLASLLFALSSATPAFALWHRDTALSPDGSTLLFTHRGDIYRVASSGGDAIPVTTSSAVEGDPRWSVDGQWIAYTSDRHGNLDVYIVPAAGGSATRLTFHEADDVVTGFSADNAEVLFLSARYDAIGSPLDPHRTKPELYSVAITGGTPRQVTTLDARQARWNRQGSAILYADDKGESFYRKRDDSPFARDIWLFLPEFGEVEQLTTNPWNDHTPVWGAGEASFFFISERSGSFNVWHQSLPEGESSARQITFHETQPVRDLTASRKGDLAYSLAGQVYFGAAGETPAPVPIRFVTTPAEDPIARTSAAEDITEFVLSPNDREIAFVVRGDVFVTSADFETTRRITATPGIERNLAFTPDGRGLLYAGERLDQWKIYESRLGDEAEPYFFLATRIEESVVIDAPPNGNSRAPAATHPAPSPDGRVIAYLSGWQEIRVFDRQTGRSRTVVPAEQIFALDNDSIHFSWSPDSRWLAADIQPNGRLFFSNIAVVAADASQGSIEMTRSGYLDAAPVWHESGGLISWITGRYGYRQHGGHGAHYDVQAQFLNQDAWDRFRRTKEDVAVEEGNDDDPETENDSADATPDPVVLDTQGAFERQARLTIHSSDLIDFELNAEASVLYYLSAFENGYDLWSHDFREQETTRLVSLNAESAAMQLFSDDSAAIVLSDGVLHKVDLEGEEATAEAVPIAAEFSVDTLAERTAILHHLWQTTKDRIYTPEVLAEAEWDERYAEYLAQVDHISNSRDLSEMLSEFTGDLNVSHAYSRFVSESLVKTGAIGAVLHYDAGAMRIAEVLVPGPLSKASDRAAPGQAIVAVNDQPLGAGVNYWALMADTVGLPTRLTLRDGRETYDVVVRPVSLEEERAWLHRNWVESRHQLVEELSDGRLGYVYVPEMSDDAYRQVYSDIFGRHFDKEGIVIDVRDNRGGDLVDWLVQLFTGKQYMWNIPRGRVAQGEPLTEWVKPSIALTNEGAYSDGHCFVAAWKSLGIGTIVGMPVTGTCTYAGWEVLGGGDIRVGTPRLGIRDAESDWMERKTTHPDVRAEAHPASVIAGRDVQLESAVTTLLKELDGD
jgi:Tol biopolymer transport system component/C-terminal processing protease CtpA/Prc